MDDSVSRYEPVEGVSAPKPDATPTRAEAEHLVEALGGLASPPRVKTEGERLNDTLERIVEGYRERSGRVIVERPLVSQEDVLRRHREAVQALADLGLKGLHVPVPRTPVVEAPVPHDLDAVVARLRADDMRKLRLAEAMAGGPVVVGRFFEDGRFGLRQAVNRLTRVVHTDDTRTATRIIPPTGSIPLGARPADRQTSLNAVSDAGYEVAPVAGDPFGYSYEKPPRVAAFEEAFGPYVEGTEAAMLGPVEGGIDRVVCYFSDVQKTQVLAGFSLNGRIWDQGVMLWLRV